MVLRASVDSELPRQRNYGYGQWLFEPSSQLVRRTAHRPSRESRWRDRDGLKLETIRKKLQTAEALLRNAGISVYGPDEILRPNRSVGQEADTSLKLLL